MPFVSQRKSAIVKEILKKHPSYIDDIPKVAMELRIYNHGVTQVSRYYIRVCERKTRTRTRIDTRNKRGSEKKVSSLLSH